MEFTKLKAINEYRSVSINPMKEPSTTFEMYSVSIYDTGHPEYLLGSEIGSNKVIVEKDDILHIPLSSGDYQELQRVLTEELGSEEDYRREFGDTPFGLLIRRIAKLDHDAAMEAFSGFINDESLNQKQIAFVHKVINHVEQNGYMEDITQLQKPPFDKPVSFIKLFDAKRRTTMMHTIQSITENATKVVG